MARALSLQETIQRSQELAKKMTGNAATPSIGQKADSSGIGQPTTAWGAGLIPGVTPDQAKMMGTPAQKGAAVAQLGGESQLEQAVKLRGPAAATLEEEAKKRRAASLAQATGTFGDKASELVERTFQNITSQKVMDEGGPLQLKINSAAEALSKFDPTQQADIGSLIAKIGSLQEQLKAELDPVKKESLSKQILDLTLQLNQKLGRDATSSLKSEEVTLLIDSAAIPETVKEAARAGVKTTIGDKLTLSDFSDMGTSVEELSTLLDMPPAVVSEMTWSELETALNTLTQTGFGETQKVTAGITSGLLSQTEKAALRDVLVQLQEKGIAGAELQVGQLANQVAEGATVTVNGQQYSIEELMGTDEFTEIVKDVLNEPEGPFATSLKEGEPELYNWILSSRDGLTALITGAGVATTAFRDIQEENVKLLTPLSKHSDFFKKAYGFDTNQLRTGKLTVADLPPSAQAIFKLPAEAQSVAFGNLVTLPPNEVASLNADEVAKLGLERTDGLWSQYKNEVDYRNKIASIPNSDYKGIATALNWPSVDEMNQLAADAILLESIGGPKHPFFDIDVNKSGSFDEADVAAVKEKFASQPVPPLKEVANAGGIQPVKTPNVNSPVDYGNQANKAVVEVWRDKQVTGEERQRLISPEVPLSGLEAILDSGALSKPGMEYLSEVIGTAVAYKVNNAVDGAMKARGRDVGLAYTAINNMAVHPTANWDAINTIMSDARNTLSDLEKLASQEGNARIRNKYQEYINNFRKSIDRRQADIDATQAEMRRKKEEEEKRKKDEAQRVAEEAARIERQVREEAARAEQRVREEAARIEQQIRDAATRAANTVANKVTAENVSKGVSRLFKRGRL